MKILQDMSILLVLLMTSTLSVHAAMTEDPMISEGLQNLHDNVIKKIAIIQELRETIASKTETEKKLREKIQTFTKTIARFPDTITGRVNTERQLIAQLRILKRNNEEKLNNAQEIIQKLTEEHAKERATFEEQLSKAQETIKILQKELATARSQQRNQPRLPRPPRVPVLRIQDVPVRPRML